MMDRRLVLILGLAALTLTSGLFPTVSAGTTITQTAESTYSVSSEFINFLYTDGTALSIENYDINEEQNRIFDKMLVAQFTPTGEPYVDSSGQKVIAEGQYGRAVVHNNPATVINFETHTQNLATFRFSSDIGAINLGSHIYLGNEDMRAELVLRGEGEITKISPDEFSFFMEQDAHLIFRNDFMDTEPIGDELAGGLIAGELFVSKDQYSVTENLVDYLPISMKTVSSSDDRLEIDVEADFQEGKLLIFDISREVLNADKDDLTVNLDEKAVRSVTRDEILEGVGKEPSFAIVENEEFLQVYLYAPSFSSHVVVFGKALPEAQITTEMMLGLGIAAVVTIASAVYIFRRNREY